MGSCLYTSNDFQSHSLMDIVLFCCNSICYKCGLICLESSQFKIELDKGLYLLKINGVHQFDIKCELIPDTQTPTKSITNTKSK